MAEVDAAASMRPGRHIKAGLTLMSSHDWLAAASPLLVGDHVEALEWSWDVEAPHPPWALGLVDYFADHKALYGHGVMYSPFSAEFEPRQRDALAKTQAWRQLPLATHVTEHVGFATIMGMVRGAPLPAPPCRAAVVVARDQLRRIADIVGRPVGLENLALAISPRDIALQGDVIEEIVAADDAPFVLDVHNLYCQAVNFSLSPYDLLRALPLHRVREIHVSGGRMHVLANGEAMRRDTHDHQVPAEVWELLAASLPLCPRAEVVMLERLAGTLTKAPGELSADFFRMKDIIGNAARDAKPGTATPFVRAEFALPGPEDVSLLRGYQHALVGELRRASPPDAHVLRAALAEKAPAFAEYAHSLDGNMLAIAHAAFARWAK